MARDNPDTAAGTLMARDNPDNAAALTMERGTVAASETITITLREGGGFAARLVPGGSRAESDPGLVQTAPDRSLTPVLHFAVASGARFVFCALRVDHSAFVREF